ncbi:unnamed protein product [Schistocephalus solidus]|uniref:2-(3-amino-3-carboxypropyl)histidine synthase subunit 1 n=2 Tax=Schistocephalus solidus TaxID=70667 RepID=A0A183TEX7_SCHSO|nr:unnamed protein product [Schistocephalus solidus]
MPPKRFNPFRIPDSLIQDPVLSEVINRHLPNNYNFEIHKTIWRIRCLKAKCIALQMPEGLLRFATVLSEIFKRFGPENSETSTDNKSTSEGEVDDVDIVILGDVSYGACCIDDFSARALGVDLLVHYGHSCLVPLESPSILYVFVDIQFDMPHFVDTVKSNYPEGSRLALTSTIQFVTSLPSLKKALEDNGFHPFIPQVLPLSPGEILGCTSPRVSDVDFLLFIGDGRFHLESLMLANPNLPAYLYDPYNKTLTREVYDHDKMRVTRRRAIEAAASAKRFGIILGTLGRQGSPPVVQMLEKRLENLKRKFFIVLLSEITPAKLDLFGADVDVWIQVACPRLSIDWGSQFSRPLLTPYEASVALGLTSPAEWTDDSPYPTDYYANDSRGPWTPNHIANRPVVTTSLRPAVVRPTPTKCPEACSCTDAS